MDSTSFALFILAARLCLGTFFLPSAVGKFLHWHEFIDGTDNYRVLPTQVVKHFAILLPLTELCVSVMLLTGIALSLAGVVTALLLLCFILALSINLVRGRRIACSCYGIADTFTISWGTVTRNVVLLLLTLIIAFNTYAVPTFVNWRDLWQADAQIVIDWFPVLLTILAFYFAMIYLVTWLIAVGQRNRQFIQAGHRS